MLISTGTIRPAYSSWADCALVGLGGLRIDDGGHGVTLRLAFTPDAQGKGYGPELGRTALAFAFEVVGLERVIAITRPENLRGQRSLEKFGMVRERELKREDGGTLLLYAAVNQKGHPDRAGLGLHHRRR